MRGGTAVVLLIALLAGAAGAQSDGIRRQPLETSDLPGHGLHSVLVRTTFGPGAAVPWHRHAGLELAFVERGVIAVSIGSGPVRTVTAGGSFQVAPETRHTVRNAGRGAAIVVSTYIVDPTVPLATPAP